MTSKSKPLLAETHPELAAQADGWDPTTVTAGSNKSFGWRCEFDHRWEATVKNRANRVSGCPVCSNKQVLVGFNDLATTHPDLAAQADGWDPTTLVSGTPMRVQWICELKHTWLASVRKRVKGSSCPICSNKQLLVGFNDLATINPELASQADGWDPTTLVFGSMVKVGWKCELGHQWKASVARRSSGRGCSICVGQKVLVGFNDLATINPELASQADGWDPSTVTAGTRKKVGWKCTLGHQWKAAVAERTRGRDCPVCAGKHVLVGFNDLATINPELASQADDWDPKKITKGSSKKVRWKCELGHQWEASVANRSKGRSCPICIGQEVLVGFNDLATIHPELAAQADGWDPKTVLAGTGKKVGWKCELGHQWKASVNSRSSGNGCPSCATSGFDPSKPSYFYLVDNFDLSMLQIGITNDPKRRLSEHGKGGWEVVELRGPMDGHLTRQLESSCLEALKKRGAILGHNSGTTKFDGYTEAWTKASLSVTSIKQLLDWVYEDEGIDTKP